VRQRGTVLERLLGLERLERAQRAPELGHRRAAIAQQGLERACAVAIAYQRQPETAACGPAFVEQLGLNAVCPRQPPGGDRDPPGEHHLEHTDRRQLLHQASSPANSATSSSGSTRSFCARMPCFSAFRADLALPSSVFGPRDFAPFWRLASARALLTGTAGPTAAPIRDMAVILG
jgi:hypothetical protein